MTVKFEPPELDSETGSQKSGTKSELHSRRLERNVADKDADRLAARERRAVGERITSKMVDEAEEASKKIN